MKLNLKDKVALVTGAGRGLGSYVAVGLAEQGAQVALVARSKDQLLETDQCIRDYGRRSMAVVADVGCPEDVDRIRQAVQARFGTPSILINAAADPGPLVRVRETNPRHWIATIATNTIGPYLVCRSFLNDMIELGWGRIINFSSAAALHPPGPLQSAYATSKVALNHFTRHLAADLAGSGVTANVIHPGEVKTAMWVAVRDEAETTGPDGQIFRDWAHNVASTGGDDPKKTLDLVLKIIQIERDPPNGQFLWIEDGLQSPLSSW